MRMSPPTATAPSFLRLEHHRDRRTGQVYDLAARPHPTVDVIPYFHAADTVYVLARTSYPRPILGATRAENPPLDGSGAVDYVTEPLNVLQTQLPLGQTIEQALERAAGVPPARIRRARRGTTYYPSPGGILEEVTSVLVEIDPQYLNAPLDPVSGFSTSGRLRAIEARQLLRAAQVGGLPDARLELNVHDLLLRDGLERSPWIGDELKLEARLDLEPRALAPVLARPGRRQFQRATAAESHRFIEVRQARFEELTASGEVVAARSLELVVPRLRGPNTIATALLARSASGEVMLGLDDDDLPAAQCFSGNSELLVTPAWRVPREILTLDQALAFVVSQLAREYGAVVGESWELGGPYRPSPGLTPEVVHPFAFEVRALDPGKRPLVWVPLAQAVDRRADLADGHLRIAVLRASHALSR